MISITDFQHAYQSFYEQMRKYIWDWNTVDTLAELEVAMYDSFPDKEEIRQTFYRLDKDIKDVYKDDEEFKAATEELRKVIENEDTQYLELYKVKEVLPDENSEESKDFSI